ncbi:MAG: peptidase M64 [Candidatus Marinimicrobia bacterium]|nr:peptidase M64 [Candidatus Neomarinimicrobiota bacterium]
MVRRTLLVLLMFSSATAQKFDEYFTGKTLRFDYYHSGIATEEHISLDGIRLEGNWPGGRVNLIDDTNLGKYLFEVIDLNSNRVIYSRGFASIYGEWETTGEARRGVWRSIHESQRFPEPKSEVQLVLKKRQTDGSFSEIYTGVVNPKGRFVDRSPLLSRGSVWNVFKNGKPEKKVDILLLGDGYTAKEKKKFRSDVKRFVKALFDTEPFKSQKKHFNVRAIDVASDRSGISNPRKGSWFKTPLGLSFNSFDSDRYVLSFENKAIREIAANAPYDAIMMLANTRKYGGGGIFNLYATVSSDTEPAEYVFVHEFGHSFAGLADEYYTSSVAYEDFNPVGVEPWEPNVTALLDADELKWKELVDSSTPLPTPWNQEQYDRASYNYQQKRTELRRSGAPESEVEKLFREVKSITEPMLKSEKYFGKVGAFEGAMYTAKGLYRPEADCIMFTRNPDYFCKVCSAAILRVIDLYVE